ncbi:unnamed protein product [Notodromas monacha]|uniref:Uncharacterized protein n=1 Tax=Notodromas monacha TaxID=399045 RepID=A0A7R9GA77_9CRUS|nr:unnamed protein product [Notodromas monacha]CAG0913818.1 unnamed protein product [Notodromas monacha]
MFQKFDALKTAPPPPPSTTTTTEAPTPPPSPSPIVELASAPQTAPEPQVSPAVDPNLDSIKELKDRLLSAIRSNPEAAAVAAAAIRDAAKASSRSGATGTSASALEALSSLSGLRGGNRVKRRAKRQTMPPTETKPNYSIDFTGNPLNCNCELKWLFDFGYKYSDQFFGLACGGECDTTIVDVGVASVRQSGKSKQASKRCSNENRPPGR